MIVTTEKENCSLRQVNLVQAQHAFMENSSVICFTVLVLGLEEWIFPMKKNPTQWSYFENLTSWVCFTTQFSPNSKLAPFSYSSTQYSGFGENPK